MEYFNWFESNRDLWDGKQSQIEAVIAEADWQEAHSELPMMVGGAVDIMVAAFKLPDLYQSCFSHKLDYGLVGVRGQIGKREMNYFAADLGDQMSMLCTFSTEKEEAA